MRKIFILLPIAVLFVFLSAIVFAALPTMTAVVLNSSSLLNTTHENLTAYPIGAVDTDGDNVTFIYNWFVNGTSIAVLNMPFDSNLSATTTDLIGDYSGRDNNGTLGAGTAAYVPNWTAAGVSGGAYNFSYGTVRYINVDDAASIDFVPQPMPITIEAWVMLHNATQSGGVLGKINNDGSYAGGGFSLSYDNSAIYSNSAFRFLFLKTDGQGGTGSGNYGTNTNWDRVATVQNNTWSAGVWYHIVATWDGTTGTNNLKIYINGTFDANHTGTQSTLQTNDFGLKIGRTLAASYGVNSQFNGTIDEVRIYNRTLTAAEIYQRYTEGLNKLNTSTIVSNETSRGNVWRVNVTPNDGTSDGSIVMSSPLEIISDIYEIDKVHSAKTYQIVNGTNNNQSRSFFAQGETVRIITNMSSREPSRIYLPIITITYLNGTKIVTDRNMTKSSGDVRSGIYSHDFNIRNLTANDTGWFNISFGPVGNKTYSNLFYVGSLWNYTNAADPINSTSRNASLTNFPFRIQLNISEPNVTERYFEVVDKNIVFSYGAYNNSIRVLLSNGTHLIEIPSQVYNISQSGDVVNSANVVFLTSLSKGVNQTYYIYFSKASTGGMNYSTDLNYSNQTTYYVFDANNYKIHTNKSRGGVLTDLFSKIRTYNNLSGTYPMQASPTVQYTGLPACAITDNTNPSITIDQGPVFISYIAEGQLGTCSINYTLTYNIYSHTPSFLEKLNFTTYTSTQAWDYYTSQELRLADGRFANFTHRNTSGIFYSSAGIGDGADVINMGDIIWAALYNFSSLDAAGEIFLERIQSLSTSPDVDFSDTGSYELIRKRIVDSTTSIPANNFFYTKDARIVWDPSDNITELNTTYWQLTNPINITVSSAITFDTTNPTLTSANNTPLSPTDAQNVTCYSQFSDDIQIDYINMTINSSYITATNTTSLTGTSGWGNYTLMAGSLEAGNHTCTATAADLAGLTNTTTWFFVVSDTTGPYINNVTTVPSNERGWDPNVQINVSANITDYTSISAVILQYRQANTTTWTNITMEPQQSLRNWTTYLSNFTPTVENNWSYRIVANDTVGNQNVTNITNLSVASDWTWEINPLQFGAVSVLLGENGTIGNLTINNTGDNLIYFTLTSDFEDKTKIYFNSTQEGSGGFSFNLGQNNWTNITINTTARTTERSDVIVITIDAVNSSAAPSSNTTNFTLVSLAGGPFLLITITDYNISVAQGANNVTLRAKLQNKGNETGTSTWFAWTLPSDWSLETGTLNRSIGSFAVNEISWNNITATVSANASTGTKAVVASSGVSQGKTGSASASIAVTAAGGVTEAAAAAVTGAGGGGTPSISPAQRAQLVKTEQIIEIVRGEDKGFSIKVKNPFVDSVMKNVKLGISGFASKYIQLEKSEIESIGIGKEAIFGIKIIAPAYLTRGDYNLTATIESTVNRTGVVFNVIEKRAIILAVHDVSRDDAQKMTDNIISYDNELQNRGFKIKVLSGLVSQAIAAFNQTEYENVASMHEQAAEIRRHVLTADSTIISIQQQAAVSNNLGVKTPKTIRLVGIARSALARGDYKTAYERAKEAELVYALETKGEINYIVYAIVNWPQTIIFLMLSAFLFFALYINVRYFFITGELKSLEQEEGVLLGLIKVIQRETFEQKKKSMGEYKNAIEQYENRLSKVIQRTVELESIKSSLMKLKRKEVRLKEEREVLIGLLKEVQKKYFERGGIETRIYENKVKAFTARLSEIEERLAVIEAQEAVKKHKRGTLLKILPKALVIIITLIAVFTFTTLPAFAILSDEQAALAALSNAQKEIEEVKALGINITRANDTFHEALLIYNAQLALKEKGKEPDFNFVLQKAETISEIKSKAMLALDELSAVENRLKDAEKYADMKDARAIFEQAKKEFQDERYEKAVELIEAAHAKIDELESLSTKIAALYEASTKNIIGFVQQQWKEILIFLALLTIFYKLFNKKARMRITKYKMKSLEMEKHALDSLIKRAQSDYFEKGIMSETAYNIKMLKFGELMRDIDRRIPLLNEHLARLQMEDPLKNFAWRTQIPENPKKLIKKKRKRK